MKNLILTLSLFIIIITLGNSQTATWMDDRSISNAEGQQTVSLGNPYLKAGAKLSFPLNSSADFSDNLLFSVRFRKDIYSSTKFVLPIVSNTAFSITGLTNISDTSTVLNDKGILAGLFPYFTIIKNDVLIIPHFELSARIIPGENFDLSKKIYKVGANIELQLPKSNSLDKNTVSAGVFYNSGNNIVFNNGWGIDVTGILNLDPKSGIVIDYKKSFKGSGLMSLGLLVKP